MPRQPEESHALHDARAQTRAALTDALQQSPTPPSKVRVRAGQGLHILCTANPQEPPFDVILMPPGTPERSWQRTEATAVRYIGEDPLPTGARAWLHAIWNTLPQLESQPGWSAMLNAAAQSKGISVGAPRTAVRTSGDELVIRLLEPCNAKCAFCACVGVMEDAAHGPESVRRELERGREQGYAHVAFTGGEPTLLPALRDHVATAKALGYQRVNVQTNGVRLRDEAQVADLAAAGLDQILLSLHSHRAAVHDAVLKLDGAFEGALAGIANCVRHRIRVRLNFVAHRDNLNDLPGFLRFVYARFDRTLTRGWHGHLGVTLSFVSPIGWTLENPHLIPSITEAAPVLAQALDVAEALGLDVRVPGLCGVPLCTMPGYEPFFDEYRGAGSPSLDTRAYVAACESCAWRDRCSGYWTYYIDRFGPEELGPQVPRPWARPPAPPMSPALRRALQGLAARGMATWQIADTLNQRQIRTPRGGRWTDDRVREAMKATANSAGAHTGPS